MTISGHSSHSKTSSGKKAKTKAKPKPKKAKHVKAHVGKVRKASRRF